MQKFTGKEYLMIDIANSFGLDKKNWNERIAWTEAHANVLEELVNQAESPAGFYAGVQAFRKYEAGEPSGYPITLDGCASGTQIISCLTTDISAAKLCNVISTGNRENLYRLVLNRFLEKANVNWSEEEIEKLYEDIKKSIMTSNYGSEKKPKDTFGEKLYPIFVETMQEMLPMVWEFNQVCLASWNNKMVEHIWEMPDGFVVHSKIMGQSKEVVHFDDLPYEITFKENKPVRKGRSIGANIVHSIDALIVREIGRRCNYNKQQINKIYLALLDNTPELLDKGNRKDIKQCERLWSLYEQTGFLSARILDYIKQNTIDLINSKDVLELIESMPKKPFQVITIHDAFRCLPNYGNDIRQQYALMLALICKADMLRFIMRAVTGNPDFYFEKDNPNMWKEVLNAEYALS